MNIAPWVFGASSLNWKKQKHGLQKKKKKVYINLSKMLNSLMDDYDPSNKKNTLEAIADIVKLPGTIDAEDEA